MPSARCKGCPEQPPSTRKVTRRFPRHSVISPLPSVTTLVSLIQAPWMPLTVPDTFFNPLRTASSTLLGEDALISMTLATDMAGTPSVAGYPAGTPTLT